MMLKPNLMHDALEVAIMPIISPAFRWYFMALALVSLSLTPAWPTVWAVALLAWMLSRIRHWRDLRQKAESSSTWAETTGRLIDYRETPAIDEVIEVTVRYSYQVEARTYTAQRIRFSNFVNSTSDFKYLKHFFETGAPITVHYNPQAPDQAVLVNKPGPLDGTTGHYIAMLMTFSAALALLWLQVQRW